MKRILVALLSTFVGLSIASCTEAKKASPWPEQFQATAFLNVSSELVLISYTYDWSLKTTVQLAWSQAGPGYGGKPELKTIAWANGTTFVIDLTKDDCQTLLVPGVMPPWWPESLQFVDEKVVNNITCNEYESKGFFSVKYDSTLDGSPITLLTSGPRGLPRSEMQFMIFVPGETAKVEYFQAPEICFNKSRENGKNVNPLAETVVDFMTTASQLVDF